MRQVSIAEARNNLSALVDEAGAGGSVEITRDGKVVALITAPPQEAASQLKKKPIDIERLRKHLEGLTYQDESAGEFIRRMRDEDRY